MRGALALCVLLLASAARADDAGAPSPRAQLADMKATLERLLEAEKRALTAERLQSRPLDTNRADVQNLRTALASVPAPELLARVLSPKEVDAWKALTVRAEAWADDAGKRLDAEQEQRGSVIEPLCRAHWGLDDAMARIAHEKANPSGVVGLQVLHDAGEAAQLYRQQIATLTPQYVAYRRHDYTSSQSEEACVEEANGSR
jgi:hypothetical protein